MKTSVQISEEMRKRMKLAQDKHGITMAGVIKVALMRYLREEGL